jgi:transcriptional regulator with XRE-family HTH domain
MAASAEVGRLVGRNIRHHRKLADLSQEELAFRAGIHRTAVGQLERGERVPRVDTVIRLAGCLELSPGDLLAGVVWEPIAYTAGGYRSAGEER